MTTGSTLQNAFDQLSPSQREAVDWNEGAALVLAGPGVGKTTVLTARLARIIETSKEKRFRVLALTFTTKAGDEMRKRVETLIPGLTDRATIGTFHSFCTQILRQHGSHIGIQPDFGVYDQESDRLELLRDALREVAREGHPVSEDDVNWLKAIDTMRNDLIGPDQAISRFSNRQAGEHASLVYSIYENALRKHNILDFSGMILDTCRLIQKLPAVAARIRQSYPYWMIDEFQDTTPSQYRLVTLLAGDTFRNVFAVADDDQIIYQWAGASYRQIVAFREQFEPALFQLVENRRCPPEVVCAANHLVRNNVDRTPGKQPLVATCVANGASIALRNYGSEIDEASGIAQEIAASERSTWGKTVVLGRTRASLAPVLDALHQAGVTAAIATRRDKFLSPQFAWLQACLDQSLRPSDKQVFATVVNAANRIVELELDAVQLQAEAEATGLSFLECWGSHMSLTDNATANRLGEFAGRLVHSRASWSSVVTEALSWFSEVSTTGDGIISDAADDRSAWDAATRAIRSEKGSDPDLAELLQGIALRPKEPTPDPSAVTLMTIHAAKGLEFDYVWLIGLAESILPSWQSLKVDAYPAELEEERRNCFVAITRTRKKLILSRAASYRGYPKVPSRFLKEMGL